jgi:sterol desaturase/sphingolipid hydroxylase (fatty acid hydroxylase superfamily)
MISLKSFLTFLLTIGNIQYYFFFSLFSPLIHIFIYYFFTIIIYFSNRHKESIGKNQNETVTLCDHYYIISISLIDSLLIKIILELIKFRSSSFAFDLITFTPVSLLFEIIFDFFHYWAHRFTHINKFLYKKLHKTHHLATVPNVWSTFHQNPFDYLFNNGIPLILTTTIINNIIPLSLYQFSLILIYKIFIEISGHCGKKIKGSSFTQNIWIVKKLHIELYTEDHDLHHTLNNCNYSKRLSLWDKVFGTYKKKITNNIIDK